MSFVNVHMENGNIIKCGSIPGERLDVNFSGSYVAVGRGNTCHFKELMTDVAKIVFINNHEGPDIEIKVSLL